MSHNHVTEPKAEGRLSVFRKNAAPLCGVVAGVTLVVLVSCIGGAFARDLQRAFPALEAAQIKKGLYFMGYFIAAAGLVELGAKAVLARARRRTKAYGNGARLDAPEPKDPL